MPHVPLINGAKSMISFPYISASASAGKGVRPDTPILSHGPSKATFIINNYDSSLRYFLSSGIRVGNTINLNTSGTVICEVTSYTQKGVVSSLPKTCERRDITQTYTKTGETPGHCDYLPLCGGPYDTGNGCANCVDSGGLCIYCSAGNATYEWIDDSTPSGYTKSYGEWWKIV